MTEVQGIGMLDILQAMEAVKTLRLHRLSEFLGVLKEFEFLELLGIEIRLLKAGCRVLGSHRFGGMRSRVIRALGAIMANQSTPTTDIFLSMGL